MKTLCVILFVIVFLINAAFALRCGSNLITAGDLQIRVLQYCGEPASKIVSYKEVFIKRWTPYGAAGFANTIQVETWTYNFGPSRLMSILIFENGVLIQEETGSYGF